MKAYRNFAAVALLVLCACSSLGLPTAKTFNERLAVGYGTVTTVRQETGTLLSGNRIKAEDAQNVQTQADNARTGLDLARAVSPTDPTGAETKLTQALQVLQALQTYLAGLAK